MKNKVTPLTPKSCIVRKGANLFLKTSFYVAKDKLTYEVYKRIKKHTSVKDLGHYEDASTFAVHCFLFKASVDEACQQP